jgi:hypothetical protein
MEEARATLERTADLEQRFEVQRERRAAARGVMPEELDDPAPAPEPPPRPQRRRTVEAVEAVDPWAGWNSWADCKIEVALAQEREAIGDAVGQLIEEEHKVMIDKLEDEIKGLRLEVTTLTETMDELRRLMKADGAKIIDMPRKAN